MNYRHAFHAGSFADVVKHTVLLQVLEYLQKKPAPYCFIDTHAGVGCYDISAQKTLEAERGIYQLFNAKNLPANLQRYVAMQSPSHYLGSPMLAALVAREQDRSIVNEGHVATYQRLKYNMRPFQHASVHQRDAYEFLPAIIPPQEKRGLVLMDPSFEDDQEMDLINRCLQKCVLRWPNGIYLIWLPIVGRSFYTPLDLTHTGFTHYLTIEFCVNTPTPETQGLIGGSLLLINPPWQIETTLSPMLEYLWKILHQDPRSTWKMTVF